MGPWVDTFVQWSKRVPLCGLFTVNKGFMKISDVMMIIYQCHLKYQLLSIARNNSLSNDSNTNLQKGSKHFFITFKGHWIILLIMVFLILGFFLSCFIILLCFIISFLIWSCLKVLSLAFKIHSTCSFFILIYHLIYKKCIKFHWRKILLYYKVEVFYLNLSLPCD